MIGPPMVLYEESSDDQRQAGQNMQQQEQQQLSYKQLGIPVQSFATLKGHKSSVTAVDVDPRGFRMVTGSLDYTMRMWDFHGMNRSMNSFRVTQPIQGNSVRNLTYNTTGTHVLVVCGGKQVMLADKQGAKGLLTVKGYMYIHNLYKTKGHTNTIYDGTFHPRNQNEFVTCSGDGSIRLWDMEQKLEGIEEELGHKTLLRCLNAKNLMTGISAVNYCAGDKMVIGGCMDGSLQVFSTTQNLHRPQLLIRDAHQPHQEFTKILSHPNGNHVYTRCMDNSLKMWDIRNFRRPVVQEFHLPNYYPGSKMCFSPNGDTLLVGTSISKLKEEQQSSIIFMDTTFLETKKKMTMGAYSITDIKWSPILNQIVVGTTEGDAHIYFDKDLSNKGAIQATQKQPRIDKDFVLGYTAPIYNPHSLPLYKQRPTNNLKKDFRNIRQNAVLSQKPYLPKQGPDKGGKIATTHNVVQYMIQALNQDVEKVDDARIPILQLNNYTSKHKQFSEMYRLTQPKNIFNEQPPEYKEIELLAKIKEICPHCGLKLCTCATKYIIEPKDDDE